MNLFKTISILVLLFLATSCASGYKTINPETLNYVSKSTDKGVILEYKYELLKKKYHQKELLKDIRLIAVKLTNNSDKDIIFGKDLKLTYDDGAGLYIMENEMVFKSLKQSVASYLWYLLLTPLRFYTTDSSNGYNQQTSSTPVGLIVGPGIAGGNMIAANSANKKFIRL
ncbi:hypothetical protein LNI90_04835 [Tenacibaculum dicentrarchi]|nr:hypothetical protein [Tenacibaculum dicentrarchi]MCD8419595.1 hypothetical protein [Tenacibaculum dicentrarchi]MCD8436072.1 hypothetical protein [Tenacibaculum dicentrarchi]MCD8451404.1 hypothetical protein [Tenacibaculum dicentrarchi]MCG8827511.1 hypothetical protein [Tenacibaculum dicentrarchi]